MTSCENKHVIDKVDVCEQLDANGFALTTTLLSPSECEQIATMYEDPSVSFRSRVSMKRYNFGQGEYKYFDYPLPTTVQSLRQSLYPPLAVIANEWARRWGMPAKWPSSHNQLLALC